MEYIKTANGTIGVSIKLVTPKMADAWLGKMGPNRNYRSASSKMMADDIIRGWWKTTHQGIAFDENGDLIDGQHRLHAIIIAGKPVEMLVFTGVLKNTRIAIDQHSRRSPADNIFFETGQKPPKSAIGSLQRFLAGPNRGHPKLSVSAINQMYARHSDAISFVTSSIPGDNSKLSGIRIASVFGALMRAYYNEDHVLLARFGGILGSGFSTGDDRDRAVIYLRDYLKNTCDETGASVRLKKYLKTERAVVAFCGNEHLKKLVCPSTELYPNIRRADLTTTA